MFIVTDLRKCLLAAMCSWVVCAHADDAVQPLDDILRTAQQFLVAEHGQRAEPPQIRLQPLDVRLRLPKCRAALEAFLPSGSRNLGNVSIGVRCPDPAWTIYPRAEVRVYDHVLVARHFLRRNSVLSAGDFRTERRELSALPGGYETDPNQFIGKQLRQAVMAGMVVSPRVVKIPSAVQQGETVTLIIRQGAIQVTSSGVALQSAGVGERVRVRNAISARVIEGTVIGKHQVEVSK